MRSRLFVLLMIALTMAELLQMKLKGQSDAVATAIAVQSKYAYVASDNGTQVDPGCAGSPFPFRGDLDRVTITLTD